MQKYHSENKGPDQVAETQAQVDELKGIMVRNIGIVALIGIKMVQGPACVLRMRRLGCDESPFLAVA